ncbi:FUSC family protein [Clavibacter michiganensis]|nr:FUSC family protein [Clavibacter michiganensis]
MKKGLSKVLRLTWSQDLGLQRLTSAARATGAWLSVVAVLLILVLVLKLPGAFVTPGLVAVSVGTMSLGMDLAPRRRLVPLLVMAVTGSAGLALGTLVLGRPVLTALTFFGLAVVTLVATIAGAAGTLLALVAIASFYASTLVHPTLQTLPLYLGSTVIGSIVGALVLAVLLRENPVREANRMLKSLRATSILLLEAVPQGQLRVARMAGVLNRSVSTCRRRIDADPQSWPAGLRLGAGAALAQWEVDIDRATTNALKGAGTEAIQELAESPLLHPGPLRGAYTESPARDAIPDGQDATPDRTTEEEPPRARGGRSLLSTAVQLLTACSLALVVSQLIDPVHWFWCVLAALVMLFGTTSASDALGKGSRRILGTAAGLPVGLLLVAATHQNLALTIVVVLLAQFAQQYLASFAYGWSIFFLTVLLSVLFGQTSSDLAGTLQARLLLTVVGAGIGAVVALTILPTRTGALLIRRGDDALSALEVMIQQMAAGVPTEVVDRVAREVETRCDALRAEAGASRRGWPLARGHRIIADQIAAGDLLAREVRRTAQIYTPTEVDDGRLALVFETTLARTLSLRATLSGTPHLDLRPGPPLEPTAPIPHGQSELGNAMRRIDQELAGVQAAIRVS